VTWRFGACAGLELHPVDRASFGRLRSVIGLVGNNGFGRCGRQAVARRGLRLSSGGKLGLHRDFALIKFRLDETERFGFRLGSAGCFGNLSFVTLRYRGGFRAYGASVPCARCGVIVRVIDFHSVGLLRPEQELRRLEREETQCSLRRVRRSGRPTAHFGLQLSACGASVPRNRHRKSCWKVGFRGMATTCTEWRFGAAPARSCALRRAGLRALVAFGWQGGPSLLGSKFSGSLFSATHPTASAVDRDAVPVVTRHALVGFGRRMQHPSASVGGGGGSHERVLRSAREAGEQVATTRGQRPQ